MIVPKIGGPPPGFHRPGLPPATLAGWHDKQLAATDPDCRGHGPIQRPRATGARIGAG